MEATKPTIVVGLDGSAAADAALAWAADEAALRRAELVLLVAWRLPRTFLPGSYLELDVARKGFEEEKARAVLAKGLRGLGSVPHARGVLREGSASHHLIEMSAECDLLVVGSRGLGGFAGLCVGSVAQAVVARSHCPVVVYHGDASSESTEDIERAEASR